MSERNGDKSRFGRKRKERIQRRKRNRELRETLAARGVALSQGEKNAHGKA